MDNSTNNNFSHFIYFSVMPTHPTQRGLELRDDILSLVKFWHVMHSDKKYMKSSDVVMPGV